MAFTFVKNGTQAAVVAAINANTASISAQDLTWWNLAITAIKSQIGQGIYLNVPNISCYINGAFDGNSTRLTVNVDIVTLDPAGNIVFAV